MELTKSISLFRRSRALESEIEEFMEKLSESSLMFKTAIKMYLADGYTLNFEQKLQDVNKMESDADNLRRAIETKLYAQTLIPESRGDVLGDSPALRQCCGILAGGIGNPRWSVMCSARSALYVYRAIRERLRRDDADFASGASHRREYGDCDTYVAYTSVVSAKALHSRAQRSFS